MNPRRRRQQKLLIKRLNEKVQTELLESAEQVIEPEIPDSKNLEQEISSNLEEITEPETKEVLKPKKNSKKATKSTDNE